MSKKRFLVNDETINKYGFRILTSGIRLDNFLKNPIALWMHERGYSVLPIGKWVELKVEEGKLYAELEFDEDDEFAVKLMKKVDKGIINACSLKVDIITLSSDPKDLLPGQRLETLTESELVEISLVDIPGNANAVRLFRNGEEVKVDEKTLSLSAGNASIESHLNPISTNMKQIALALGLAEAATEEQILAAVNAVVSKSKALSDQIEAETKKRATALVDGAIQSKKLLAEKRDATIALAMSNYEAVEAILSEAGGVSSLSAQAQESATRVAAAQEAEPKTFRELTQKGEAFYEKFRKENPEKFAQLYAAEYGRTV